MAAAEKKPKTLTQYHHRLPPPLSLATRKLAARDPLIALLTRGGVDATLLASLEAPDDEVFARLEPYLADPAVYDPGEALWDEALVQRLDPAEKRAYKRSYNTAAKAQSVRAWGLFYACRAARFSPPRVAQLAAAFGGAALRAQCEIARAVIDDAPVVDRALLSQIVTLFDAPPRADTVHAFGYATRASMALDPDATLGRLRELLAMPAAAKEPAMWRSMGALIGLGATASLDPAWSDVLKPLFGHLSLGCAAAYPAERLTLDPSWCAVLTGFVTLIEGHINVQDPQILKLLSRVATADEVWIFEAALAFGNGAVDACLDGLARVKNAETARVLRGWARRKREAGHDETWPPLVRAEALLAETP